MIRRVKLLVVTLVAVASLALSAGTASAQGYTGWIEHPYPSAGLWYCDWYGDEYWCWSSNNGQWVPANPNWYDASSAEMMRVFDEPVL